MDKLVCCSPQHFPSPYLPFLDFYKSKITINFKTLSHIFHRRCFRGLQKQPCLCQNSCVQCVDSSEWREKSLSCICLVIRAWVVLYSSPYFCSLPWDVSFGVIRHSSKHPLPILPYYPWKLSLEGCFMYYLLKQLSFPWRIFRASS